MSRKQILLLVAGVALVAQVAGSAASTVREPITLSGFASQAVIRLVDSLRVSALPASCTAGVRTDETIPIRTAAAETVRLHLKLPARVTAAEPQPIETLPEIDLSFELLSIDPEPAICTKAPHAVTVDLG